MLGSAPARICAKAPRRWLKSKAVADTFKFFGTTVAIVPFLIPSPLHAQYMDDFQTNIISGVTSNWVDNPANPNAGYVVGSNFVDDALLINGGGVLSNGYGYIGYEV